MDKKTDIRAKRKNIRLKDYDYSSNGYYFVTICTNNMKPIIIRYKDIVERILVELPKRFAGVRIDYYVLMNTHIHIIFAFDGARTSLGEVVRCFKALVSKKTSLSDFWQRGFYEHVIRNEKGLAKIREYIQNNPLAEVLRFSQFYESEVRNRRGSIHRTRAGPTNVGVAFMRPAGLINQAPTIGRK